MNKYNPSQTVTLSNGRQIDRADAVFFMNESTRQQGIYFGPNGEIYHKKKNGQLIRLNKKKAKK